MGDWVQIVAQGWLVYDLTRDPSMLGLVTFMQQVPAFFIAPFGGALADQFNKRRTVMATQGTLALSALTLAALTIGGVVQVWHIMALGLLNGTVRAFDWPSRQSLISELVERDDLPNAIPLTGATFNIARFVGPAVGGLLLEAVGPGLCFLVNGISFATILIGLAALRPRPIQLEEKLMPLMQRVTEGVRVVIATPAFRTLVMLEVCLSTFGMFYVAQLPAFAEGVIQVGEKGLGYLYSAMGVGAVSGLGMLALLSRWEGRGRLPAIAMNGFGLCLVSLGAIGVHAIGLVRPWAMEPLALLAMALIGFCSTSMLNAANALLQANAEDQVRGRVLAVHFWALIGVAPFGNLGFGYVAKSIGVAPSFVIGGTLCLLVAFPTALIAKSVRSLR
jgi:MFS family permease